MPIFVARSAAEWLARFPLARSLGGAAPHHTALSIGNFDGVHCGHQAILRAVVEAARAVQALPSVITFDPHPLRVLRPVEAPAMLSTLDQRIARFEELGIAAVLALPFNRELAALGAQEFVQQILVQVMRARAVLVGENFRFGHRQVGDVALLSELGRRFDFGVSCVPPVVQRGKIVSSTAIREAVRAGRVSAACRALGRPYSLCGVVRTGAGMGRRLVVPTLNLAAGQEVLPKPGVYATETVVGGRLYRSAANVGFRPTFDGQQLTIESHLFNFNEELTAGAMEVRFWTRLRDERKFPTPEALRAQILRDLGRARLFFRRLDRARKHRPSHQRA
jgi:riboflavin kinase / FMN adenylyltransferase